MLGGILLVGLGLRMYRLTGNLYSDEVWIITTATSKFSDFLLEPLQDWVHPPLFHFLARAWVYAVGFEDHSIRIMAMIFGVLSIPLIYAIGRRISGARCGIVAATLLALSPSHIYHSQYGRHYSLFVFLVLVSMCTFFEIYAHPANRKYFALYTVATTLLVYTHYFGWMIVACQSLFFISCRSQFIKRWAAVQAMILFAYAPWVYFMLKAAAKTPSSDQIVPHIAWIEPPALWEPFRTLAIFNGTISFPHQAILGTAFVGGIFALSMRELFRKEKTIHDEVLILLSYVVIPFFLVFIVSYALQPIWILRAMMLSLPAYYLLISLGALQFKGRKYASIILMVIPLFWMSIASLEYIRHEHRMPYERIALYLEKESDVGTPILVENTYLANPIYHYFKGKGFLYELDENNVSVVPANHKGNITDILDQAGNNGDRLVLVTYTSAEENIRNELSSRYRYVRKTEFFGFGEEGQTRNVHVLFFNRA